MEALKPADNAHIKHMGENAQGQQVYGCGKAGECQERSKEQNGNEEKSNIQKYKN